MGQTVDRHEPRLADLLDDPVARAVMARDRVKPEEIIALVHAMRETRRIRTSAPADPRMVS